MQDTNILRCDRMPPTRLLIRQVLLVLPDKGKDKGGMEQGFLGFFNWREVVNFVSYYLQKAKASEFPPKYAQQSHRVCWSEM